MSKSLTQPAQTPARTGDWFEGGTLANWRDEMEQMFKSFFGDAASGSLAVNVPRLDLSETDDAIEVDTDLPGVKAEEVQVDVVDNRLTISGQHQEEKESEENGRKFHRIERRSGSFSRSVWLPSAVVADKVEARLADGVLHIRLPKAEVSKRHKVAVKT